MAAMENGDAHPRHSGAEARDGGAWRGLLRALRLRCPRCGIGRLLRSWFSLREACAECGLRFERDEQEDYWLGAYTLNFIVTELIFAQIGRASCRERVLTDV